MHGEVIAMPNLARCNTACRVRGTRHHNLFRPCRTGPVAAAQSRRWRWPSSLARSPPPMHIHPSSWPRWELTEKPREVGCAPDSKLQLHRSG